MTSGTLHTVHTLSEKQREEGPGRICQAPPFARTGSTTSHVPTASQSKI